MKTEKTRIATMPMTMPRIVIVVELDLPFGDVVGVGGGMSDVVVSLVKELLIELLSELLGKLLGELLLTGTDADAVMILVDTESDAGIGDWVLGDELGGRLVGFGWEKVLGLQVLPSCGTERVT